MIPPAFLFLAYAALVSSLQTASDNCDANRAVQDKSIKTLALFIFETPDIIKVIIIF